jgi:hypothetical protein
VKIDRLDHPRVRGDLAGVPAEEQVRVTAEAIHGVA